MKYLKSVLLIVLLALVFDPRYVLADEAQWVTKKPLSEDSTNLGVITVNGEMYRIGGLSSSLGSTSDKVYKYDPKNDTWIPKASMHVKREHFALAESNGKIYVFGGFQSLGNNIPYTFLNSVEEYDPTNDVWTVKAEMPTARMAMGAATVKGRIYVVGGMTGSNGVTTSVVEEYNPATNLWTKKTNIPTARSQYGIGIFNDKIYIVGGFTPQSKETNIIEVYEPGSDTWTTSSAVSPSLNIGNYGSITYKGNFYFIGYFGSFIFSPSTETWTSMPALPNPREGLGLGILNGRLYSIGGRVAQTPDVYEYILEKGNTDPDPGPEPTGSRAILTITLTTGIEKEYDLSIEEVNAFLKWYDAKDAGTGPAKFAIDKHSNNKGPFAKRTEYVIFDKILTFEVSEYTAK
ncbi:hypothetical protein A3842_02555 [Paenibacillus sp. P3E]|uniref:Kelch repeat-containing protein n=1 Tax=Paenibacillus sp. P3E TaxID=1349435 RepID=UPI000939021D|nr:kelch repeat-containing protein [Paenibacillus sp. P3E]OKP92273.1 hypothetical protein A3842_02555 [Paenibacillus sp. P3E]